MDKNTISIGPVALGSMPRIVAVVDKPYPLSQIKKLSRHGVTLLEIRFDLFTGSFHDETLEYVKALRRQTGFGLIGTLRETKSNKDSRVLMFFDIIKHIHAVDIEIDTPIAKDVIALARKKRKMVIVSEHNFKETPDAIGLKKIAKKADRLGADIIKIATMAKNRDDVARLLTFTSSWPSNNLVTIAMGEHGAISRVAAPLFGSLFSYCSIGNRAVAPGQLSIDEVNKDFIRFYK